MSREQKNDLNKKVHGLLVSKITAVSRNSIDTLCITSFIGLTVSGIYSNYYYIMTSLVAFSAMILNSMMASVGNSIATENPEKNYRDMRLFDFIYSSIAGWATVCLICLYQPFIQTWLGKDMILEMPVVIALCVYFYILKSGDIRYVYQEGAGQWYEYRFVMIGEAIANIILNIVLCKVFGLLGIVLATVITVFVTNMFFCPRILFKLYFKTGKLKEYWQDHLLYFVTMFITALLSSKLSEMLIIRDYSDIFISILGLIGRLGMCTVISAVVFWVIWHRSERYKTTKVWMKRLVSSSSP